MKASKAQLSGSQCVDGEMLIFQLKPSLRGRSRTERPVVGHLMIEIGLDDTRLPEKSLASNMVTARATDEAIVIEAALGTLQCLR